MINQRGRLYGNCKSNYVLAIFSLALIAGYSLQSCSNKRPTNIALVDYLINGHFTTNTDSAKISQQLKTLLQYSVYHDRFFINQQYNENVVNVYIIDGQNPRIAADEQLSQLRSNCEYLGYNIVLIDVSYLKLFFLKHHVDRELPNSERFKEDQKSFFYW